MQNSSLSIALAEVSQILDILGNEYINKIPYKFIKFMNENKSEDIKISITEENYKNVELTRNTIVIISMLNFNYWITDKEEKERLLKIYQDNDKNFLKNASNYKSSDWLITKKEENNIQAEVKKENKYLINIEEKSIFSKILNFIKNIFIKEKE